MANYFAVRRKTAAAWTSANPILNDGQLGFETDTKKWKIGDGTTAWNSLAYLSAAAGGALLAANNLSDLGSAATARTNLGLGSVAVLASSAVVQVANNLSDVTAATARTNLAVPSTARQVIAGTAMSGGGDLTADRTLNFAPSADVAIGSHKLTGVTDPSGAQDAATKNYVDTRHVTDLTAPAADFSMNSHKITNVADPGAAQDAATQNYVLGRKVTDLTAPSSSFSMNSQKITSLADPSSAQDAMTLAYRDAHDFAEQPSWHGLKAWTFAISAAAGNTQVANAGQLNLAKIWTPAAITITTIYCDIQAAGAGLTAAGFALYDTSGNLLQSTVATSGAPMTQFQSTGAKTVTVTSQAFAAGSQFYIGFFFTGTTMPTITRGSNLPGQFNMNLAAPNLRGATSSTGLTTTMPNPYATQVSTAAIQWWFGVS